MIFAIFLAAAAFMLAMVALLWDPDEGRLRYPIWDAERGRPHDPGRFVTILAGVSFAIFLIASIKVLVEGTRVERAEAEAERQWQRVQSLISHPEVVMIADFAEDDLRRRAAVDANVSARLTQLLALVRLTPIPPGPCNGIELRRGAGAVPLIGDMLVADGGLSLLDFAMTLGFYRTGKDISQFTKGGFDLFDMTLGINGDNPQAQLSYLPEAKLFRLVLTDEGDGLDADAETITAISDLPGSTMVLEPATPTNAFERGFVKSLFIRDRLNGAEFGLAFPTLQPPAPDSGWPPHTLIAELGDSVPSCVSDAPGSPVEE